MRIIHNIEYNIDEQIIIIIIILILNVHCEQLPSTQPNC